jgi:hypothetical protein
MMKPLIQVCGDPTVDWFRIHNEDITVRGGVYYWQRHKEDDRVRLSSQPGGFALVRQVLKAMIPEQIAAVEGAPLAENLLNRPKDRQVTTSWTLWKEFFNSSGHRSAYRLWKWHEFEPAKWDYQTARLQGNPDLLLIQDSGLGFRHCEEGWPEALSLESQNSGLLPAQLIIKLGQYYDGQANPLLNRIAELGLEDRTIILSSLSDLRACAVKVSISLSWEKVLEEVVGAVLSPHGPFLDADRSTIKYQQVIVPIGLSGAVVVGRDYHTLIFDRNGQEGHFAALYPGQIIGDNTCILGALAASWAANTAATDWIKASRLGIELARLLQIEGYEVVEREQHKHLQFPYQTIASAFRELSRDRFGSMGQPHWSAISDLGVFVDEARSALLKPGRWTILEDDLLINYNPGCSKDTECIGSVHDCAKNVVVYGPQQALQGVPVEIIGGWSSADRQEIEGVRGVNNAMREYCQLKNPETPLCVAVFGPPGSGKSFVIKEIARGLGIDEKAQLTFNLSQFDSPAELQNAFHQVRDLNLKGKMPLVFWDEFDTPCEGLPLGWLRYFLAPMQDGEFTYEGLSHPLGGGIFVFAGATRHSFEEFRSGDNAEDRAAKKPDFISRLRAFINIKGINGNPNSVEDRLYVIRRAFILRQYLETNAAHLKINGQFEIEPSVLDAFLLVSRYWHGARSLENLLKMSSLADKRKYELSSLPPDHIVEMHVNMKEFNDLTKLGRRELLRIGITGHVNLDPEEIGILSRSIDRVIAFIERQFPAHYLTVFSPLAAGADRLVAGALLKDEAARLIAVLPFSMQRYLETFGASEDYRHDPAGAELRSEYEYWINNRAIEVIEMPPTPTRRLAYLKAGQFIAEHSNVIIVVWDGNRQKYSSVTAQVVARAEALKIPICHIWAQNYRSESCQANIKPRHGEIRYKNFPGQPPDMWTSIAAE